MTEDGRKSVRAIVRGAQEKLALERQRRRVDDPLVGMPRDGVMPGKWGTGSEDGEPMPGEMPPDCPVRVLGLNGDDLYCIDAAGQLSIITDQQFGQGKVERLFGDRIGYVYWAWPRWTPGKDGKPPAVTAFRTEKVRQSLWSEATRLANESGQFDALNKVRGRGVWRGPGDKVIVHCGDYLYIDGRLQHCGDYDGMIYPRMPAIVHPWHGDVDETPALQLLDVFKSFSWARPTVDPLLTLGWMGCAMMSGALRVRPSIFVVGDKGWGKTTLQEIIKLIFGDYLLSTNNTTPAGIYQKVKQDARPVAIDELEAGADNRRVLAVVELARLAYSGGVMLRGGSDHQGVEFEARSSFLMSAINRPPVNAAEMSRMGVLSLVRPPASRTGEPPIVREQDELGSKLLRRLMNQWQHFDRQFQQYAKVLHAGGHDQRGQDTYGTLLTCAHLLLGDEGLEEAGYPIAALDDWSTWLATASLPEYEDMGENWSSCIGHLLTKNLEIWRGGSQLSIGAVLDAYERDALKFEQVNNRLAQVTMRLLHRGEVKDGNGKPMTKGDVLAIPNSKAPAVSKLFEGSTWSAGPSGDGVWGSAMRQAPAGVIVQGADNRVTINRHQFRCTLLDLAALDEITKRKSQRDLPEEF